MPEKCPLSGGGQAIEYLPKICMAQCFDLWNEAHRSQAGIIDDYPKRVSDCMHLNVVTSHEGLQATNPTSRRIYSIVDMCEDCETELHEVSYTFECPYN